MPLSGSCFWACILPQEATNLITNCSFERGSAGWGTLQAGTLGTTSTYQTFGAWAGSVAPTSNGTAGAVSPTFTAGNGTTYYFSAYVRGANGIPYRMAVGDANGVNFVGSTTFTGGGTWQRYVGSWTEASGATRRLVFTKNASADTSAFYVDGVQVEPSAYTTYVDGDQDGCTWAGAAHASTSSRSGQSRAGGSVVALADLGMLVDDALGIGMPPLENTSQSYAILDGAQYQRTRAAQRAFTLDVTMLGASLQNIHATRRAVINAFKIDRVTPQQPVRFWYTGAGGTVQIDAVYDDGLQMGELDGFTERAGVRFVAYDPYWTSTTQQGTALAPRVNLGSTNYLAYRDPLGRWGTLGANGTTVQGNGFSPQIWTILPLDNQTVLFGGVFGTVGGTIAAGIGKWNKTNNTLGTLTGGTLNQSGGASGVEVRALALTSTGTVYMGGNWGTIGGTVYKHIGFWNQTQFGTLTGGTVDSFVNDILITGGTTFLGGQFSVAGGTVAPAVVMHSNGVFGTLTGGTVEIFSAVSALARGLDGRILLGGGFANAGGTNARNFAYWKNGAFGTFGSASSAGFVDDIVVAASGVAYLSGIIGSVNATGSINNIMAYNGVSISAIGSGLTYAGGTDSEVFTMLVDEKNFMWVAGRFDRSGAIRFADGLVRYNGYAYLPPDIQFFPAGGTIRTLAQDNNGTIYIGGTFAGTAQAAGVAQVINAGMARAYPVIQFRNIGATGTARIYQLLNTTTGDDIYLNTILQPQEEATLDLTPGARSFQSNVSGNLFGNILPGSNLASWRLLPGTNYVSFFADSDTLQTSIIWTPRHWSADAGTIA